MHFVKIWDKTLDSSLWGESSDTFKLFVAMLLKADPQGRLEIAPGALRRAANLEDEAFKQALFILESPDLESKSQDYAGRRIEKIDGGWQILNYKKYRDLQTPKQAAAAERQRTHRERVKQAEVTPAEPDTRTPEQKAADDRDGFAKIRQAIEGKEPPAEPRA